MISGVLPARKHPVLLFCLRAWKSGGFPRSKCLCSLCVRHIHAHSGQLVMSGVSSWSLQRERQYTGCRWSNQVNTRPCGVIRPSDGVLTMLLYVCSCSCISCDPGWLAESPKQRACKPCGPGFYNNEVGSSFCHSCELGKNMLFENATSCVYCAAARFAQQTGQEDW